MSELSAKSKAQEDKVSIQRVLQDMRVVAVQTWHHQVKAHKVALSYKHGQRHKSEFEHHWQKRALTLTLTVHD